MRAVRALVRFRWLLPAIALPILVAALGVGMQAAAFSRPPGEALTATTALGQLLRFRVMRATENIGHQRIGSICVQGLYRTPRHRHVSGALVLLDNGEKLYDFGYGVHEVGRRGRVGPVDEARFLLAGCPRFVGGRVAARLMGGRWIDTDPSRADGASVLRLTFGERAKPIDLYVGKRTFLPVALRISGDQAFGWSDLMPGGGRAAVVRVFRAFHLNVSRGTPNA